jgi:CRP-like cAMP-binding protein
MSDSLFPRFGREFRAGDVLFREGESGEVMFVIQSGVVRVSKVLHGSERTLATFGRGDFIGEMAILNDKPRTATATVVEDATVLVIDGKTLEKMIAHNSEIALRLIKKLAIRLDAADEFVQILLNPDPEARVMLGLKRLAESLIAAGGAGEGSGEGVDGTVVVADVGRLLEFLEFLDVPRKSEGR